MIEVRVAAPVGRHIDVFRGPDGLDDALSFVRDLALAFDNLPFDSKVTVELYSGLEDDVTREG